MLNHIRPAIVMIALFTGVLGVGYPLAVTGVAQAAFSDQANGSLVRNKAGRVVGSALVGQTFAAPEYLHPRPSAAGDGYDAAASSGSNLGPLNPDLIARVKTDADALQSEAGAKAIPADAVTASASGLDPHISPAYAELQAARIAKARGVGEAQVREVIRQHVEGRTFGVLGQPRVNVLLTNQALDARLGLLTTEGG
ncbi:potassium-transporting ATPase subunit C [Brevundimonas diminuta]|uniref:potassium-transporting ATPase subunit KdpC n=1 Tax=Brevundimonas diminuta TaxID=293 RepID=UPI000207F6FD|nr:potassium-transporting ATPase subunit KdpC [Brevundimonas diminuta]EGF94614.1 K+-transporting ATPase, C subunit [Brevundimonas diminuta ATCC 11568]OWR21713.1 potassium-transporting ATPase subunit C [Brevundimonas diminuta]WQE46612.1 potassium-transporting ATPase subunit KdpC [Brevundimonas diminuta]SPU47929.1 potassium-transporting ATPase subunit C [Brevundimonas diminuta]SUW15867.1 potassium-transporting ATPase subunit C [Brevundimonas diminuta]